jgi:hypothetical protein
MNNYIVRLLFDRKNIVSELIQAGMSDTWILRNIWYADESLRLKQTNGLTELFKSQDLSNEK